MPIATGCRIIFLSTCFRQNGKRPSVLQLSLIHIFLVGGQIAERKLKGFIETGVYGFMGDRKAMIGYADVPDFTLGLGFLHGLIQAAAVSRLRTDGRVVELIRCV